MKVSENSSEIKRVRDHVVGFEPPDICLIQFGETLTRDDSLALLEEELRLAKEHGDIFVLVDFTRVRSITADARKLSAETTSPPAILGIANFGVSFRVRVLTKLVVSLRRLARLPVEGLLYLGADEADARAWIARRKLELKQTRG